jgi:hypothetical protein
MIVATARSPSVMVGLLSAAIVVPAKTIMATAMQDKHIEKNLILRLIITSLPLWEKLWPPFAFYGQIALLTAGYNFLLQ